MSWGSNKLSAPLGVVLGEGAGRNCCRRRRRRFSRMSRRWSGDVAGTRRLVVGGRQMGFVRCEEKEKSVAQAHG